MSSADPRPPVSVPAVVIGVPVYGQLELTRRALTAIDRHTPVDIELIVIDDCGPQRLVASMVEGWLGSARRWRLISHQTNQGFVGSVNELFELAGDCDVLVVNSDVEVLPGWFAGLAAAVAGVPRLASASTLATAGSLLSVPELDWLGDTAERLITARAAVEVSAEIPVAVAHCTWFTRAALHQVGLLDRAFAPGYGEEVDWSLRAARLGLVHLAALHSYVRHSGGASFGPRTGFFSLQRRHELRLLLRYPVRWWRIRRFAADPNTECARAIGRIRQILAAPEVS
ncbi:MAG: glycosyltransferase family 2 protein [Jatrophihabitans sp.]